MAAVAAVILSGFIATTPALASGAAFYVSPSGDDSNPGTIGAPFQTIDKARLAVRAIAPTMDGPVIVYLRGGTYTLTQTLEFDAADSGQNGSKVIYTAYEDETPIVSGGYALSSWSRINGGLDIWKATVPPGFKTRDVYVNGERAPRSTSVDGLQPDGGNGADFQTAFTGGVLEQTDTGYIVNDAGPQGWGAGVEFVWTGAGANTVNGWAEPRCPVASVAPLAGDASKSVITMAQPCYSNVTDQKNIAAFAVRAPSRIEGLFYNNDLRTQLAPGHWALSGPDQGIFYFPRSWEDMSTLPVVAGQLETLVKLKGTPTNPVHDINFEGITFTETTWLAPDSPDGFAETQANEYQVGAECTPQVCEKRRPSGALDFESTTAIAVDSSHISNIGGTAVRIWGGAHGNSISHSTITDVGANCIGIGDTDNPNPSTDAEKDLGNVVSYNTLDGCAVVYRGGVGIWAGYVGDTSIINNELMHMPYSGISLGWGWGGVETYLNNNRIAFNNIHHTMEAARDGLIDGGGIYLNGQTATGDGDPAARNKLTDNWIHDQPRSIAGIYLDAGASRWDVTNNVVEKADSAYWYLLGGTYNALWDNFTDAQAARVANGDGSNSVGSNVTGITSWPSGAEAVKNNAGPQ